MLIRNWRRELSDSSFLGPPADRDITSRSVSISLRMQMNRMLLLQSVMGHLALLEQKYPKKAASPVARKAKRYIEGLRKPQ